MKYKSYPKVNIFLIIKKKNKKNNLHKIASLFCLVNDDLYDDIEISFSKKNKNNIEYIYNDKIYKTINDCIFEKAIKILRDENIIESNVFFNIKITKNMPLYSGLGSGSSNVACLFKFLLDNKKIKLNKKVKKIILKIGSDVLFFITNYKLALVYGYGNKIKKINWPIPKIKIFTNNIDCSTKKIFENYDKQERTKNYTIKQLLFFRNKKYNLLVNELEKTCFLLYPEMNKIKEKLKIQENTNLIKLSGSGSSFYQIL